MVSLHKASRLAAWDFSARRDCPEVVHGEGMGVPTSLSTLFPIGQCAQWGINSSSLQDCIPQSCQQRPRMSVPTAGCIVPNLSLGELGGTETLGLGLGRARTPGTSEWSATNGRANFAQLRHSSSH